MEGWRIRLGALLLVERVQVRKWNRAQAAREVNIDAGTIRRIEHGHNYEIEKLERYADKLGRPLETWLRQALAIPDDLLERLSGWSSEGETQAARQQKITISPKVTQERG